MSGASNQLSTKPEHMLPVMIVLGVMFVGICIAMNLFSRQVYIVRLVQSNKGRSDLIMNVFNVQSIIKLTKRDSPISARFKKRRNVFTAAAAARTAGQPKRTISTNYRNGPGGGQRLNSTCASPMPPLINPSSQNINTDQRQISTPNLRPSPRSSNIQSSNGGSGRSSVMNVQFSFGQRKLEWLKSVWSNLLNFQTNQ